MPKHHKAREREAKRASRNDVQEQFLFRENERVGTITAENDHELLESAWYDHSALKVLTNVKDARCIVLGRTGSGKSAVLWKLEQIGRNVEMVDPFSIAARLLDHQTIIPGLVAAGINFDAFFKFLWRQTLVAQLMRGWRELQGETKLSEIKFRLITQLTAKISVTPRARRRKAILEEIESWAGAGDRWEDPQAHTEQIIRSFDTKLRGKLTALNLFDVEAEWGRSRKEEVKRLAPQVVTEVQGIIAELVNVQRTRQYIEFLREDVLADETKPRFLLIDQLDVAWIEAAFAYDLIDALIEVAGELAQVGNVKVVVALRDDIVAQLHGSTKRRTRQWEKHRALFLPLRWREGELLKLIDLRLNVLLKQRYKKDITLKELLPLPKPGLGVSSQDWLLERTLLRPRDLIAFVNAIVEIASKHRATRLNWNLLSEAEERHSLERLEALDNEWQLSFGGLRHVFEAFRGLRQPFTLRELLTEDDRLQPLLTLGGAEQARPESAPKSLPRDCAEKFSMPDGTPSDVWEFLLPVLHRIAFVGAKFSKGSALKYSYEDDPPRLLPLPIDPDMSFQVHKAFWRALDLTDRVPASTSSS